MLPEASKTPCYYSLPLRPQSRGSHTSLVKRRPPTASSGPFPSLKGLVKKFLNTKDFDYAVGLGNDK